MIIGFKDADKLLYHYTKPETAREHILATGKLKLNSLTHTNDPKEVKQWQFNLHTSSSRSLKAYQLQEISKQLSDKLKTKTKVMCFCKDRGPLSGDHLRDIFRRGYAKPRMWAQYADNHVGVCLVFDREKLSTLVKKQFGVLFSIYEDSVIYQNRSIVPGRDDDPYWIDVDSLEKHGFENYAQLYLERCCTRLFFEKMTDWRDEDEFRWLIFADSDEDMFIDFEDSLVGLVFGDNAKEQDIEGMMSLAEPRGIECMGVKWHNCSPWYDFQDFRYSRDFHKLRKSNGS